MQPKKTVLYVITKATWGGAQKYVWDLMAHAHEYGYDPALAYGEPGILSEHAARAGFKTYRLPSLMRDVSVLKEFAAKRELRSLFERIRPDIVHLNSSKAGYTGARAAREAGVGRVVFTAHGWAFMESRSWIAKRLFAYLQRKTVEDADVTIAVSDFIHRSAPARQTASKKIVTVALGIEPPAYLSRAAARAALISHDPSLEAAKDAVWVGTIAELHKNKGIDIGVEAWKRAGTGGAWIVLGEGEEHARLRTAIQHEPNIHLLGFVPEAAQYLKAFDLFMLPSRTESFGYVVLEAGLADVPVIASDAGGIPETVANPEVLARAGNAAALARLLEKYTLDAEARTRAAAMLRTHVAQDFSFSRMLHETFACYEA